MGSQWWSWEENPGALISWLYFWPCLSSPAWASVSFQSVSCHGSCQISVVAKHINITADLALILQFFAPLTSSLRTTTVLLEPAAASLWDVFNFPVPFWEVLILRECLGLETWTTEQLCCEEYGFNQGKTMLLQIMWYAVWWMRSYAVSSFRLCNISYFLFPARTHQIFLKFNWTTALANKEEVNRWYCRLKENYEIEEGNTNLSEL